VATWPSFEDGWLDGTKPRQFFCTVWLVSFEFAGHGWEHASMLIDASIQAAQSEAMARIAIFAIGI